VVEKEEEVHDHECDECDPDTAQTTQTHTDPNSHEQIRKNKNITNKHRPPPKYRRLDSHNSKPRKKTKKQREREKKQGS
jgi:hypothetical protein